MPGTDTNVNVVINGKDNSGAAFKSLSGSLDRAASASKAFALTIAGAVTAVSVFGLKTAAGLETAQIGLETLLGSADAAGKTMDRIKEEAKKTPFEIAGLTSAVQLLSSVTKDGDRAIDIILDVGEGLAAMGKGQSELDRIIVNLQQIAALGRANTLDIKQFAFAGIPIYEMLTEATGKAGEALDEFITQGGVTFDVLTDMFDKANDSGGRFFNAYINQTGSLSQLWSNLKDTLAIASVEFVRQTGLFELVKKAVAGLTDVLGNLGEWITKTINFFREHEAAIYIVAGAITGALVPALYSMIAAFVAGAAALAPFMLAGAVVAGIIVGWDKVAETFSAVTEKVGFLHNAVQAVYDFVEGKLGLITLLKTAWESVWIVFETELLPSLLKLWEALQPLMPYLEVLAKVVGVVLYGAFIAIVKILEVSMIAAIKIVTDAINGAVLVIDYFKNAWDGLTSVLAKVIDMIDKTISKLKSLSLVKGAQNVVGGLLSFDSGGVVPGAIGSPQLAVVHGGETILPTHKTSAPGAAGGTTININISGNTLLDSNAGEKIGAQIVQQLKYNLRFST